MKNYYLDRAENKQDYIDLSTVMNSSVYHRGSTSWHKMFTRIDEIESAMSDFHRRQLAGNVLRQIVSEFEKNVSSK